MKGLFVIDYLIKTALKNRLIVCVIIIAVMVMGVMSYRALPTDAFPDISPIMVPVFVEAHGMAPEEVERLITFPIESAMNGLPSVDKIKSTSAFGMAVVYVYFEDDIDIYFARQLVSERLSGVMDELPELHEPPKLGPIATGLGEVFMYYLTLDSTADTEGKDPGTYLREVNDWIVKYQLQSIKGVTEILSMGGHVLEYQIQINPYALRKYDLVLEDIVEAVNKNNKNAGGQFLVIGSEEYLVRGIGFLEKLEDIRNIPLKSINGTPIRMRDISNVEYGNAIRRGVVTRNGEDDIVYGIVYKLIGENTSVVLERLWSKLDDLKNVLPKGVHFHPHYDQGDLVDKATSTVEIALLQGAFFVLLTLLVFMGTFRTALIVAFALPFCALSAFIGMGLAGLSSNLMSLGGIAIALGMLVDGAIIMVENIFRHLSEEGSEKKDKLTIIIGAAHEVGRPIVFSLSIVIIVFIPIFTLEGVEGKMFSPMALSMSFAILGSIFVALIIAPVLAYFLIKQGKRKEFFLLKWIKAGYLPLLLFSLKHKVLVTLLTLLAFGGSLYTLPYLGTEFMPVLEEGSMIVGVLLTPSTSLVKTTESVMKIERTLLENFKDIEETVAKIGRPEAGSHPHPINYAMIQLTIKGRKDRKQFKSYDDLREAITHKLNDFPEVQTFFTQPIQHQFDDLISGVKSQLALDLYGEDIYVLKEKAEQIKDSILDIEGLVDVNVDQSFGQPQLRIEANREACARYGVNISDLLEVIELAIGGETIDQIYLNNRRFAIHVRYQEEYRSDADAIKSLLVHAEIGSRIPLGQIADVREVIGPLQINRQKNLRKWSIQANVRGRDMGSVVADIKKIVNSKIDLPPGYILEYGGQFKNQERAMKRLTIIVPIAILLIFFMIYLTFNSLRTALLIILSIPLSLIGGVFGLYFYGEYLSVPAAIGFIALFGVAVQDAMVMVSCIRQQRAEGKELQDAIVTGAMLRLRPVLVTTVTTFLGLFPLLASHGVGAEVQRPLAVVVIFGLTSSTILTLLIKPALYGWFEGNEDVSKIKVVEGH